VKPVLKLCWALLEWPGLVFATAIGVSLFIERERGPSIASLFFLTPLCIAGAVFVAIRIGRFGSSRIWNMLPAGNRVFARALALLVLGATFVLGGLADWANTHNHRAMPLSHTLASYVVLSFVAFVLLWNRGSRIPLFFGAMLAAFFAFLRSYVGYSIAHHPGSSVWWMIAGFCTLGWVAAILVERTPYTFGRGSWMERLASSTRGAIARLRGRLLLLNSPSRSLLLAEHRRLASLPGALLFTVAWALLEHALARFASRVGTHPGFGSYEQSMQFELLIIAIPAFVLSLAIATRARLLWLRGAESRAQLFREAERTVLLRATAVGVLSWLVVTSLALARATPLTPSRALTMGAVSVLAATIPIYAALTLPTLQGRALRVTGWVIAILLLALSPGAWLVAFIGLRTGTGSADFAYLAALIAGVVLLRALASQRWKSLDWSRLRLAARPRTASGAA